MRRGGGDRRIYAVLVALLFTGCDLNPRPEDPGINTKDNAPSFGAGTGGTTSSTTPRTPTSGTGGAADIGGLGAGGGGPVSGLLDAGASSHVEGRDASADAGDASADAAVDAR